MDILPCLFSSKHTSFIYSFLIAITISFLVIQSLSSRLNEGFSAISTDELYFINGGSATTGQKVGYSVARVVAEIVFIGNDCPDLKEA